MNDPPVLHVIYAAYGDALLLELPPGKGQNHRRLVIVDGGPKYRFRIRNNAGPYSDYFVSAVVHRWEQLQEAGFVDAGLLAPVAIVNSHGDHDHYEGLLEMMRRFVEYEDQTQAKMNFQGPFLVPVAKNSEAKIEKRLKACKFYQDDTQRKDFFDHFPGLSWDYPLFLKEFLAYFKKSPSYVPPPPVPDQKQDDALQEEKYDGTLDYDPDFLSGGKRGANPTDPYDPDNPYTTLQVLKSKGVGNTTLNPAQIRKPGVPDLDKSTTNLSSILLTTTDDMHGYVVTTGDSIGHRIHEVCIEPWQKKLTEDHQGTGPVPKPHLNVFKVPHHGSVKNNQLNKDIVSIKKLPRGIEIAEEVSLRELLELQYGPVMPADLPDLEHSRSVTFFHKLEDVTVANQRLTCQSLAILVWNHLQEHSPTDAPEVLNDEKEAFIMCRYLNYLRRRHAWYIDHFKTTANLISSPPDPPNTPTDSLWPAPDGLWFAMVNIVFKNAQNNPISKDPPRNQGEVKSVDEYFDVSFGGTLVCKTWWSRWNFADKLAETAKYGWLDFYDWVASVERVYRFYMTFKADVYVISANGSHGHPSPATVLGIALAVTEQQHTSSIYLTNGAALPNEAIELLAASLFTDMAACEATLGANAVCQIRYDPDGKISMPIVCKPDRSTSYFYDTERWSLNTNIKREEIFRALEQDHTLLPTTNSNAAAFQFGCKINGNRAGYLAGRPMDKPTPQRTDILLYLKEFWNPSARIAYFHVRPSDSLLQSYFAFHKREYEGTFDLTFYEEIFSGSTNHGNPQKVVFRAKPKR